MNLYNAGERINFTFTAYNKASDLDVRFKVYDITSGSGTLVATVLANYLTFGVYEGSFVPVANKLYLVVGLVYDGSLPDPTWTPVSETYREVGSLYLATSYGTYDQNDSLFIQTSVYDSTAAVPVFIENIPMFLVAFGVYIARYLGALDSTFTFASAVYTDNTYTVLDDGRSPGSESIDCVGNVTIVVDLRQTVLNGQLTGASLDTSVCEPCWDDVPCAKLRITQGDNVIFNLTAMNNGLPVNLTGASFETSIRGPYGLIRTFDNSQHTANPNQTLHTGWFTLTLSDEDTASLAVQQGLEVLTKITLIGGSVVYFHGRDLLDVLANVPTL